MCDCLGESPELETFDLTRGFDEAGNVFGLYTTPIWPIS